MAMREAVLIATAATIGNMLQGWDNGAIAGAVIYIKKEFNLQSEPTVEGLILVMSLIGATCITAFAGAAADALGRRPMLIISSILYFFSGVVMYFAPNVYILLLGRALDGFGLGLACTLVPMYISETAPSEIRGTLNTIPQFTNTAGTVVSYCMVFGMSLVDSPNWRLMLGVISIPALAYFFIAIFLLPESPRWLVSKGRIEEAKLVLQRLRGREDVAGEMALLVEGLGVGGDASIEEYIIVPDNELNGSQYHASQKDQIKLYGAEEGVSWIAKPVRGENTLARISRHGSVASQRSLMDPMVTLFGSVHEKLPDTASTHSVLFSNYGSRFNMADQQYKNEPWDEESQKGGEYHTSDDSGAESDDNLRSPLLSHQSSNVDRDIAQQADNAGEQFSIMGVGSGWQLAYRKDEKAGLKKIYLHQESNVASQRGSHISQRGSHVSQPGAYASADGGFIHAAALVSQSVLRLEDAKGENLVESFQKPVESATKGPSWRDLLEPGVKRALIVGAGVQMFQQFIGINGLLMYTPQILDQAGVGAIISNMGLKSESGTLLLSCISNLLNLPFIGLAMRLMDISGRRSLLLSTVPVLILSLLMLVVGNLVHMAEAARAVIFTSGIIIYLCFYCMGFGPIPNLLCSEIFPTRVRGLCIAICASAYWISNIIVTFSFPVLLNSIGLAGAFGIYAVACVLAWIFVFSEVPETKGMPLEVITEIFALGAKQRSEVVAKK